MKTPGMLVLLCLLAPLSGGCGRVRVAPTAPALPAPAPSAPSGGPLTGPVTNGLPAAPAAPVVDGVTGQKLDALVTSLSAKEGGFTGSVLVARGGKVLLDRGYGLASAAGNVPMPHDAMWDWASVGKQFTSAAILKLRSQGRLGLDDSVSKLFPEAPADKRGITLRHLLTHTSGINQDAMGGPGGDGDGLARAFFSAPMAAAPGAKFEYCNPGYELLAVAIARASGTSYEDYLKQNLFRPALMREATFIGQPDLPVLRVPLSDRGRGPRFEYGDQLSSGYRGAGGAVASTRELLVWDEALRGSTILDDAAKADLYRVNLDEYALGWFVRTGDGDITYEHGGAVGKNLFHYLRTRDSRIVIAIACSYESNALPELVAALLAAARAGQA